MLSKTKHPHFNRQQRRHPLKAFAFMNKIAAFPSVLVQQLMLRGGYWPMPTDGAQP